MNTAIRLAAIAAVASAAGCINVKTESEIKPIHITMDVNLKVDKELDRAFSDENAGQARAKGSFREVKALLERGVAGFTAKALLAPRDGATDDDRIFIAEENSRRMRRFNEVSAASGVALESVQRRRAGQLREKVASGTWLEGDDGSWSQKK